MITSETPIRVRYAETDAMKFTHHSNYIIWMELARVEMLDNSGLPYKSLEANGCYLPVLNVSINYFKPSFFDDHLLVKVCIKEKPLVRLTIHYEILKDNTLLASASTTHAFINAEGTPIKPPTVFKDLMNKHFA